VSALVVEVEDDSESILLLVTTTASASGIDPSTDGGSSDGSGLVRLIVQVHRTSDDDVRTAYTCRALGLTLRMAALGADPGWLPCADIGPSRVRAALDRLVPGWRDGEVDASVQVALEASSTENEWEDVIGRRRDEVAWCQLAAVQVQS
jgi:hypothetical protein